MMFSIVSSDGHLIPLSKMVWKNMVDCLSKNINV